MHGSRGKRKNLRIGDSEGKKRSDLAFVRRKGENRKKILDTKVQQDHQSLEVSRHRTTNGGDSRKRGKKKML